MPHVAEPSSLETIESEFLSLTTKLGELRTLQTSINSDLKKLERAVQKHIKETGKKQRRKKNLDPDRPPEHQVALQNQLLSQRNFVIS